jgi:uncharacterized protein (DUF58 family)
VALVVGGRILGCTELYALGAGAAAALIAACSVLVGPAACDLAMRPDRAPPKVHVGSPSRVELRGPEPARRRSPVLTLCRPGEGHPRGRAQLAPLAVGEPGSAYRLPTTRRGLLEIGPLEVTVERPVRALPGLAPPARPGPSSSSTRTWTRSDPSPTPRATIPRRAPPAEPLGRAGEDFYALRPYEVGDDLRRVHWPSTARHDELMVRQDELPWQGRTTIALDVRSVAHARETFEVAVSAAASLLTATARRADLVRLVTSAGTDSDFGAGADHLEAIMEHLAVVTAGPDGSLRQMVEVLGRATTGGALVVVLGDPPDDDLRAVTGLRPRYGSCTVVTVDPACPAPGAGPGPVAAARAPRAPAAPGTGTVRISAARPFPDVWSEHLTQLGASRQRSGSLARGVRA